MFRPVFTPLAEAAAGGQALQRYRVLAAACSSARSALSTAAAAAVTRRSPPPPPASTSSLPPPISAPASHPPPPPPPPALVAAGLPPLVASAMATLDIKAPTAIQALTIPRILAGSHTLIAAETGSGKTLAYLAPLIARLKATDPPRELRRSRRPRAIVLVPTRELVLQVVGVARQLAQVCRFSVREALGGGGSTALRRRSLRKALEAVPTDVLVATPGMLAAMREEKLVLLSELEAVVVDEADITLAAQGFDAQVAPFLAAVDAKPGLDPPQAPAQFVYAAASLPASVRWRIEQRHSADALSRVVNRRDGPAAAGAAAAADVAVDRGGELSVAQTESLHIATPPTRVQTRFIRVSGGESAKLRRAAEAVVEIVRRKSDAGKVMVFCDRDNRRDQLVDLLTDALPGGASVVHMSARSNADRFDRWRDWNRFREDGGEVRVAVCAQSFSRGIDLPTVKHIVMTDVPMTGSEYLHRVGRIRATQADSSASVTVMVSGRDRAVAEALFLAHVREDDLSALNAPSAWRSYVDAARDRIATDPLVAAARRKRQAFWVDERRNDGDSNAATGAGQQRGGRDEFAGRRPDRSPHRTFSREHGPAGPPARPRPRGAPREDSAGDRVSERWRGGGGGGGGRRARLQSESSAESGAPRRRPAAPAAPTHTPWRDRRQRLWNAPPSSSAPSRRPSLGGGAPPSRPSRPSRPSGRSTYERRRDSQRSTRYEKRRHADAGPYAGLPR